MKEWFYLTMSYLIKYLSILLKGNGKKDNISSFAFIDLSAIPTKIKELSTGYYHTMFLTEDSCVYGCGDNS